MGVKVDSAQFVPVAEDDERRDGIIALAREPVTFQYVAVEALAFVLRLQRPAFNNHHSIHSFFIHSESPSQQQQNTQADTNNI